MSLYKIQLLLLVTVGLRPISFTMVLSAEVYMNTPRVLFLTKFRTSTDPDTGYSTSGLSSGLLNSVKFVSDMLVRQGIDSRAVQVVDGNCIDREVYNYKPHFCFIEALWVTPAKLGEVARKHPYVKFIVRLHSNTPFAANEGIFTEWINQYLYMGSNIEIHANSPEMFNTLKQLLGKENHSRIHYLPNYYPVDWKYKTYSPSQMFLHVGLFGACRPLKNQLLQAVAALKYADDKKQTLNLHINTGRTENNGAPVLKNLLNLFPTGSSARIVTHAWTDHEHFIDLIRDMDICLQVSFSETFNIVAADAVNNNIPVVTSSQVSWVNSAFHADPTSVDSIVSKMKRAMFVSKFRGQQVNKYSLASYSERSALLWVDYIQCNSPFKRQLLWLKD